PDRRVENGDAPHVGRSVRARALIDPTLRRPRDELESVLEHRQETRSHDFSHEGGRRVVAPTAPPLDGIHHALEYPAQHVGRDGVAALLLPRGKVKTLEQIVERVTPVEVRPARRPEAPLERGRLE